MASRKKFLPEEEYHRLERMGGQQLADHLSSLPRDGLEKLVTTMLHALRLKTRVANAAARWALNQTQENWDQLTRCLADFMPDAFTMHGADLEVLDDELAFIIHQATEIQGEEFMEMLVDRRADYTNQLAKLHAQLGEQFSLPERTPVKR